MGKEMAEEGWGRRGAGDGERGAGHSNYTWLNKCELTH